VQKTNCTEKVTKDHSESRTRGSPQQNRLENRLVPLLAGVVVTLSHLQLLDVGWRFGSTRSDRRIHSPVQSTIRAKWWKLSLGTGGRAGIMRTPVIPRAIVTRLSGSGSHTIASDRCNKENQLKSKTLFAVVLGSLIVIALSLPVMAQSTTQSTTTTSHDPAAPTQAQTSETTDTTVTPAEPQTQQTDTTTTTVTPQPKMQQTDTTTTTTAPPPEVRRDTTSTTTTTPQQ